VFFILGCIMISEQSTFPIAQRGREVPPPFQAVSSVDGKPRAGPRAWAGVRGLLLASPRLARNTAGSTRLRGISWLRGGGVTVVEWSPTKVRQSQAPPPNQPTKQKK